MPALFYFPIAWKLIFIDIHAILNTMAEVLEKITHDALALSFQEEVSLAWDVELEKRLLEIKRGSVTGIPAQQVLAKLGAKYLTRPPLE